MECFACRIIVYHKSLSILFRSLTKYVSVCDPGSKADHEYISRSLQEQVLFWFLIKHRKVFRVRYTSKAVCSLSSYYCVSQITKYFVSFSHKIRKCLRPRLGNFCTQKLYLRLPQAKSPQ